MNGDYATKGGIEMRAAMVVRGFHDVATKDDIRDLDRRVDGLDVKLSSYASRSTEELSKLQEWLQEHEGRLRVQEGSQHH